MATALPTSRLAELADLELWYPKFGAAFELLWPGFRQLVLDSTSCIFQGCAWQGECRLTEAHAHAAAHRLIIFQRQNKGAGIGGLDKGAIKSMSMGPVSTTFESNTAGGQSGDWSSTTAGRAYLEIRDELGPVALAPGGGGDCDDFGIVVGGCC